MGHFYLDFYSQNCIYTFRITFDSVWAPKLLVLCACSWRRYTCKLHENHNSKWKIQNTAGHLKRWIILLNNKNYFLRYFEPECYGTVSSWVFQVHVSFFQDLWDQSMCDFCRVREYDCVSVCVYACEREKKICVLVMSRES